MSSAAADSAPARQASPTLEGLRRFGRDPVAMSALALGCAFVLMALLAPWIAPHDPNETELLRRLQPPAWLEGGEWSYLFGCDALGRDILSRLVHGARVSIAVGAVVIVIATGLGIVLGLAAGYFGGWIDRIVSQLIDILLGFPYLIFAIGLMAMMGPGFHNVVLALVYKEWVVPCRVVRGETLALRGIEYVEAARAIGVPDGRIMLSEILPNIVSPIVVVATIRMAHVIILEASLSFLGLGVQPPTASWGSMVADGREFILGAWWVSTLPGIAILLLVLSVNVVSQGLRDAFDPRMFE